MAVKAQKYQGVKVHIIGIYMSTAFHTINRNNLIQELGTFSDEDECRTTQVLLSNTTISMQIGDISGNDVNTNIGSPQGDASSGTFFISNSGALNSHHFKIILIH